MYAFGNESMLNGFYIHKPQDPDPELMKESKGEDDATPVDQSTTDQPPKMVAVWKNRKVLYFKKVTI